jgi:glycerate kinase
MNKFINILVAPDKMKGTLTAKQICKTFEDVAGNNDFYNSKREKLKFNITSIPLADGGDGSLEVLRDILNLKTVELTVNDPLMRPIKSSYAVDEQNNAFIEIAAAAGLVLLSKEEQNCMHTTSYGFGQLIKHAISNGVKRVYLFLGGSATCDAGIGMATALGYKFLDIKGKILQPFGGQMQYVHSIQTPQHLDKINQTEFITLCDVKNPILGPNGAAPVFAPQKSASLKDVKVLEVGLKNIVNLIETNRKNFVFTQAVENPYKNLGTLIGGGAAGGMGLGSYAFLGAKLSSGTKEIMRLTKFSEKIRNQNCIITAEGQIDTSTLYGKVPYGVCKSAFKNSIPCYLLGGEIKLTEEELTNLETTHFYSMSECVGKEKAMSQPVESIKKVSKSILEDIAKNIIV